MIQVTLTDGRPMQIDRESVCRLVPYKNVFAHSHLKTDAVCYLHGNLVPVVGPLPLQTETNTDTRDTWLLVLKDHVQVIQGLPSFSDDRKLELFSTEPLIKTKVTPLRPQTTEAPNEESRLLAELEAMLEQAS